MRSSSRECTAAFTSAPSRRRARTASISPRCAASATGDSGADTPTEEQAERDRAALRALDRLLDALALKPALLDRPLSELSTGERQRLALLRLLCQKPQALLLD